jgi:hypothetical protein
VAEAREVHVDHHRVDHRPDEQRDDEIDRGVLELGKVLELRRECVAERYPGPDAQCDPDREPLLEEANASRGRHGEGDVVVTHTGWFSG